MLLILSLVLPFLRTLILYIPVMSAGTSSNQQDPMPPANADLATMWAYIEKGIDQIMSGGASHHTITSLPNVVYNYCTCSRIITQREFQ